MLERQAEGSGNGRRHLQKVARIRFGFYLECRLYAVKFNLLRLLVEDLAMSWNMIILDGRWLRTILFLSNQNARGHVRNRSLKWKPRSADGRVNRKQDDVLKRWDGIARYLMDDNKSQIEIYDHFYSKCRQNDTIGNMRRFTELFKWLGNRKEQRGYWTSLEEHTMELYMQAKRFLTCREVLYWCICWDCVCKIIICTGSTYYSIGTFTGNESTLRWREDTRIR